MNKATILMAALLVVVVVVVVATGLAIGGVVPSTVQTAQADPCSITLKGNQHASIECEFDKDVEIAATDAGNELTQDEIPLDELPLTTQ